MLAQPVARRIAVFGAGGIGIDLRLIGAADGAAAEAIYQIFDKQWKDLAKKIEIFDVVPQLIMEFCQRLQSICPGFMLQQTFAAIRQFFGEILGCYRSWLIRSELHSVSLT